MRYLTKEVYLSMQEKHDSSYTNKIWTEYEAVLKQLAIDPQLYNALPRLHDQTIEQLTLSDDRTLDLIFKDYGWGADRLTLKDAQVLTMEHWLEDCTWLYYEVHQAKRDKTQYELHALLEKKMKLYDFVVQCSRIELQPTTKA